MGTYAAPAFTVQIYLIVALSRMGSLSTKRRVMGDSYSFVYNEHIEQLINHQLRVIDIVINISKMSSVIF
jgi:hypothetical protein